MVEIRELKQSDLDPLQKFWNRNVTADQLSLELLSEKVFGDPDYRPDLTLIAEEDGQIVSFMMGLVRCLGHETIGWIKLFATDETHRRRGVATQLLKLIEEKLIAANVQRIQIIDSSPNYLQGGLDPFYTEAIAFVERNGYKRNGDTSNLRADLANQDFDTAAEEKALQSRGVFVRRAAPEDKAALMYFLSQFFKPWVYEVSACFGHHPISVHIALLDGEVAAFSAYDTNNLNTGWFGPMGTHPA